MLKVEKLIKMRKECGDGDVRSDDAEVHPRRLGRDCKEGPNNVRSFHQRQPYHEYVHTIYVWLHNDRLFTPPMATLAISVAYD